jgi:hypothetical protein
MLPGAGVAGVLSALLIVGAACLGRAPAPSPEPPMVLVEAPPSPTASPVAGPSPAPTGAASPRARIVGAGQEGVNLRAEPGTSGARLKGLFDGAELELLGHEVQADGRTWRDVRDPTDRSEGWVAAEFLGPGE